MSLVERNDATIELATKKGMLKRKPNILTIITLPVFLITEMSKQLKGSGHSLKVIRKISVEDPQL